MELTISTCKSLKSARKSMYQ